MTKKSNKKINVFVSQSLDAQLAWGVFDTNTHYDIYLHMGIPYGDVIKQIAKNTGDYEMVIIIGYSLKDKHEYLAMKEAMSDQTIPITWLTTESNKEYKRDLEITSVYKKVLDNSNSCLRIMVNWLGLNENHQYILNMFDYYHNPLFKYNTEYSKLAYLHKLSNYRLKPEYWLDANSRVKDELLSDELKQWWLYYLNDLVDYTNKVKNTSSKTLECFNSKYSAEEELYPILKSEDKPLIYVRALDKGIYMKVISKELLADSIIHQYQHSVYFDDLNDTSKQYASSGFKRASIYDMLLDSLKQ